MKNALINSGIFLLILLFILSCVKQEVNNGDNPDPIIFLEPEFDLYYIGDIFDISSIQVVISINSNPQTPTIGTINNIKLEFVYEWDLDGFFFVETINGNNGKGWYDEYKTDIIGDVNYIKKFWFTDIIDDRNIVSTWSSHHRSKGKFEIDGEFSVTLYQNDEKKNTYNHIDHLEFGYDSLMVE